MYKIIILLIICILFYSCSSINFNNWEDLTQKEKNITVVSGVIFGIYTSGLTYWILNPSEVPENWPNI